MEVKTDFWKAKFNSLLLLALAAAYCSHHIFQCASQVQEEVAIFIQFYGGYESSLAESAKSLREIRISFLSKEATASRTYFFEH